MRPVHSVFAPVRTLLVLATVAALPAIAHAQTTPSIAVIGTGNMGGALGVKLAAAGYPVVYGSRDPARASVEELVERTGAAAAAGTQLEAARRGDVIILAVPWEAMEEVVGNLGDVSGKVLVDVTYGAFRIAEDGYMESIEETSMTERIQSWAPEAHAVKVSMPSQYLVDQPDLLGTPPTVMIAADDRAAKEAVARLVADIGLDPFDAGPLRLARSIESFGKLFWVPLLQGRDEGIEFRFMRSSFWPCFWDVQAEFGTPDDIDHLAEIPRSGTPRPCDSYIGGEPEPDSAGGR